MPLAAIVHNWLETPIWAIELGFLLGEVSLEPALIGKILTIEALKGSPKLSPALRGIVDTLQALEGTPELEAALMGKVDLKGKKNE